MLEIFDTLERELINAVAIDPEFAPFYLHHNEYFATYTESDIYLIDQPPHTLVKLTNQDISFDMKARVYTRSGVVEEVTLVPVNATTYRVNYFHDLFGLILYNVKIPNKRFLTFAQVLPGKELLYKIYDMNFTEFAQRVRDAWYLLKTAQLTSAHYFPVWYFGIVTGMLYATRDGELLGYLILPTKLCLFYKAATGYITQRWELIANFSSVVDDIENVLYLPSTVQRGQLLMNFVKVISRPEGTYLYNPSGINVPRASIEHDTIIFGEMRMPYTGDC